MDCKNLDQLIQIQKKQDASKSNKNEYKKDMIALLNENGLDQTTVHYLKEGFYFCGTKPFTEYLLQVEENDRISIVEKLFDNEEINSQLALKYAVGMLADVLEGAPKSIDLQTLLIKKITIKAGGKNGKHRKDLNKIIEKYFLAGITPEVQLPPLDTMNLKKGHISDFTSIMVEALTGIVPRNSGVANKIRKILDWLNVSIGTDEKIGKESSEEHPQNAVIVEDKSENSAISQTTQNTGAADDKSKDESVFKPVDEKEFSQFEELVNVYLGRMAATISKISELKIESDRIKKENSILQAKAANDQQVIKQIAEDIKRVREKLQESEELTAELRTKLFEKNSAFEAKVAENGLLKQENEKLKAVTSVYAVDKKNAQEEQLNAIASKLKAEYQDFKDAEKLEMTEDLGENMRFQLKAVFKILAKAGIDVEKR